MELFVRLWRSSWNKTYEVYVCAEHLEVYDGSDSSYNNLCGLVFAATEIVSNRRICNI